LPLSDVVFVASSPVSFVFSFALYIWHDPRTSYLHFALPSPYSLRALLGRTSPLIAKKKKKIFRSITLHHLPTWEMAPLVGKGGGGGG
jgi:hypothetical protein